MKNSQQHLITTPIKGLETELDKTYVFNYIPHEDNSSSDSSENDSSIELSSNKNTLFYTPTGKNPDNEKRVRFDLSNLEFKL